MVSPPPMAEISCPYQCRRNLLKWDVAFFSSIVYGSPVFINRLQVYKVFEKKRVLFGTPLIIHPILEPASQNLMSLGICILKRPRISW